MCVSFGSKAEFASVFQICAALVGFMIRFVTSKGQRPGANKISEFHNKVYGVSICWQLPDFDVAEPCLGAFVPQNDVTLPSFAKRGIAAEWAVVDRSFKS